MQGADPAVAKRTGDQLARAARPLRELPRTHLGTVSPGRGQLRAVIRCVRLALRLRCGSDRRPDPDRSEEHTSELQSPMRISYAVFCLKKQNKTTPHYCATTHQ